MSARNALTRLAGVAPSEEPALDAREQDRILEGILSSPHRTSRRRPVASVLVVAVVAVGVAAIAATLEFGNAHPSATQGHQNVALTGGPIQMAGYHFRTPAGFKKESDATCGGPVARTDGFTAAASADGGCVDATAMMSPSPTVTIPTPAGQPVAVGSYQGYYDAQGHDVRGDSGAVLYVELPREATSTYLVLFAQGLTEDQLIAVAESGLAVPTPVRIQNP